MSAMVVGIKLPPESLCRAMVQIHGYHVEFIRRFNGELQFFVRLPLSHPLWDATVADANLALDFDLGVTYSFGGGTRGWFVGSRGPFSWLWALYFAEELVLRLRTFEGGAR